ncbi:hypothetical protein [Mesorhizobium sp. WSM3862]|uniref:hypothetical protein n=1 Tax=Mesorhizobium sp. WSM3862 TaxID=632858 RepID=UPI001FE11BBC|nr:hypothetical protein [Mesorhizobium sp. WSM3862]
MDGGDDVMRRAEHRCDLCRQAVELVLGRFHFAGDDLSAVDGENVDAVGTMRADVDLMDDPGIGAALADLGHSGISDIGLSRAAVGRHQFTHSGRHSKMCSRFFVMPA